jgi:hypothetical protein
VEFSVNAGALVGLADLMDRRGHELTGAAGYLQEHSTLQGGAGIGNTLLQTHRRITGQVEDFLRRAGTDYAQEYALRIGAAVRSYQDSDRAASTRLDASLPGVVDPANRPHRADQALGPAIFNDPACLALAVPPDYRAEFPYRPTWYDVLSPSSIIRDAVWSLSWVAARLGLLDRAYDPYEAFTVPLCGDWAGLERTSFALTQVARALSAVRARTDQGAVTMDQVWTGNAASSCRSALGRFAHDLSPAADLTIEIAAEYHHVAVNAREQGETLATLVTIMVDIGATLGADSALEVIADAGRIAEAAQSLSRIIRAAVKVVEDLHAGIEGGRAALASLGEQLGALTVHPFHPALPDDLPTLPTPAMAHR